MTRQREDRGKVRDKQKLVQDLEAAADLLWLSMAEPTDVEMEYVIETAHEKELRHFVILDLLDSLKRGY